MNHLRVGFYTLGCRLNIFESDGLSNSFKKLGIETVSVDENPEIIVINTCTVTNKADSKNRNVIRNAIKNNPNSKIWVTGCYAETDKDIILKIPGITGVLGNNEKSNLPNVVQNHLNNQSIETNYSDRFSYSDVLPVNHTRAYLKIQDGCNRVCSYCKIPSARGKGVSRNKQDILDQIRFLQDNAIGEIVLTGVNIGWYKNENGEKALYKLLEQILQILEYSRLRISSIEPSDVNKILSELMKHPRFCNFLHVPLQSGSSEILKKMKRSYTAETYKKRLEIILKDHPNIFLGTDIIVGFPGETTEHFMQSIKLMEDLEISKIHAFPYSPRKGTLADSFSDTVSKNEKKIRVKECNTLSEFMHKKYFQKNLGKSLEGIIETDGHILTDNYLKMKLPNPNEYNGLKSGQFVTIIPRNYGFIDNKSIFYGELTTS